MLSPPHMCMEARGHGNVNIIIILKILFYKYMHECCPPTHTHGRIKNVIVKRNKNLEEFELSIIDMECKLYLKVNEIHWYNMPPSKNSTRDPSELFTGIIGCRRGINFTAKTHNILVIIV